MSAVIVGSGKTFAFGIPMIHTILEWKSGSEKPADVTEPTAKVESLYLPAEDGRSDEIATDEDQEDDMEAEDESRDEDHWDSDEGGSQGDAKKNQGGDSLGCVKVIENAEFDFDSAAEAEEKHVGGQRQPLLGLVLTPTRELAVQVKHHIDAIAKFTGKLLLVILIILDVILVQMLKRFLLFRYKNGHCGGRNGTAETKEDAKAPARNHYCHSRTPVGLDQGEASTSA